MPGDILRVLGVYKANKFLIEEQHRQSSYNALYSIAAQNGHKHLGASFRRVLEQPDLFAVYLGREAGDDSGMLSRGVDSLPEGYTVLALRKMEHLHGNFRVVERNYVASGNLLFRGDEWTMDPVVGIGYSGGHKVLVLFPNVAPQHLGVVRDVADRIGMAPFESSVPIEPPSQPSKQEDAFLSRLLEGLNL